jgi:BirA family biotin operon repressor/biotin-[acetyl-CoA-carboxylase] ligase
MALDRSLAAAGVVSFDTIGSTNTEALSRARAGERGPLWITALRQEAGRGRQGRAWVSEPGNLYASLLLTDPSPPERAAELSFVAALAVHDAVGAQNARLSQNIALKWPNDLLIGQKKCGGILIESERCGQVLAAVIGIGVNCAHHPENTAYPATDLSAFGEKVLAHQLFQSLQAAMTRRLEQWARGAGFGSIRADWLARAAGLGKDIRVRVNGQELSGKMKEINALGQLVIEAANGHLETVAAGEIFALAPTSPVQAQ